LVAEEKATVLMYLVYIILLSESVVVAINFLLLKDVVLEAVLCF
jgi:hypothetical protein